MKHISTINGPINERKRLGSIIAASSGNLVEWFDFYIYAFLSVYFAHHFSISNNFMLQQIQSFGIFALGFLMRPLGSYIFGQIADKTGRKASMILSIILMAFGSFLIAGLPTKDTLGEYSALGLLLARLIQGLSVGGEYGIAATYLSEIGKRGKRGFYASFQPATLIGGQLAAVASISILLLFFNEQEMRDFAWRILFFAGGVLALLSLLSRRLMEDSTSDLHKHEKRGQAKELFKQWKMLLLIGGISSGGSLAFYTITTYTKIFMINNGFDAKTSNLIMLFALVALIVMQPIFGILSDKIGHKRLMLGFGIGSLLFIYPLFLALKFMSQSASSLGAFIVILGLFVILSFYTSIGGIFKSKFFPTHVRAMGIGLAHAIPNAIFGGSANYIALKFKNYGFEDGFFIYIAVIMLLVILSTALTPKKSYLE